MQRYGSILEKQRKRVQNSAMISTVKPANNQAAVATATISKTQKPTPVFGAGGDLEKVQF